MSWSLEKCTLYALFKNTGTILGIIIVARLQELSLHVSNYGHWNTFVCFMFPFLHSKGIQKLWNIITVISVWEMTGGGKNVWQVLSLSFADILPTTANTD